MQEKLRNQVIVRYMYLVTKALYFSGGTERGQKSTRREHKWTQVIIHLPYLKSNNNNPIATPRKKYFAMEQQKYTRLISSDQKPKAR